jgi:hypothetical protein
MNARARIGSVLLALGGVLWVATPHNVTWGNHHYLRHAVVYGLIAVGALFLITGLRSN